MQRLAEGRLSVGVNMVSVHIRISDTTKKKLDNLRHGQTVPGKYGYKKKMQYDDLIKQMLDNNYFESQERIKFAVIQNICGHVLQPVSYDSPHVLLQHVLNYLNLFVATSKDKNSVDSYKHLIEILNVVVDKHKSEY